MSDGAWDDQAILKRHWREMDGTLGDEDGVLTLDGSDCLKQGQESAGIKRQYCGEVSKRCAMATVIQEKNPGFETLVV
ncbi:transposase [Candidatus Entotheonella palauensis]|uniref:transposase n=1 Tax=Candidatus Entotheonella palauensis TaxID=93172 RepID=UPI000B7D6880